MVDRNYADVTVVMDKSGSMGHLVDDTVGGFNRLLEDQRKASGRATITLVQFDTSYEVKIDAQDVKFTRDLTREDYKPGGSTALLDAAAKAIAATGARLRALPEEKRPGLVTFVVITDGQENSSVETSKAQLKAMIERQEREFSWHFVFLGANMDAVGEGANIGILRACAVNYSATPKGTHDAYHAVSDKLVGARGMCASGGGQEQVAAAFAFSDQDRAKLSQEGAGNASPAGGVGQGTPTTAGAGSS